MKLCIELKHSVGDEVHFMHENKAQRGEVLHIQTNTSRNKHPHPGRFRDITKIEYTVECLNVGKLTLDEKLVFETKEALLISL